ncbi:MAG: hypothetical protein WDO15_11450 [Bacteroidota bacterium]
MRLDQCDSTQQLLQIVVSDQDKEISALTLLSTIRQQQIDTLSSMLDNRKQVLQIQEKQVQDLQKDLITTRKMSRKQGITIMIMAGTLALMPALFDKD